MILTGCDDYSYLGSFQTSLSAMFATLSSHGPGPKLLWDCTSRNNSITYIRAFCCCIVLRCCRYKLSFFPPHHSSILNVYSKATVSTLAAVIRGNLALSIASFVDARGERASRSELALSSTRYVRVYLLVLSLQPPISSRLFNSLNTRELWLQRH